MARARRPLLRTVVLVSTLGMVAGNIAANVLPFFGRSTGEISDRYMVLVTPAGYVFAIWGLIYVAMLAYSIGQFFEPLASDPLPDRLALLIIVANVANVLWLVLWHGLYIYLTVPVMLVLLGALLIAYVIARRERPERPGALERWAIRAPLGLYLGWVSVATIANVSAALYARDWNGGPLPVEWWAVVMLVAAAALGAVALWREGDAVFALVIVWALTGIAVKQQEPLVRTSAIALAGALQVAIIVSVIVRRRFV